VNRKTRRHDVHGIFPPPLPSISAQRKALRRRLAKERRRALVEKIVLILRKGQPTIFAFESACRAGLRSGFCIEGFGWTLADIEAAAIVESALRQIGACRPTWREGQREYTGHEDRLLCANPRCQKPIERAAGEYQYRLFCSAFCRSSVQNFRYASEHRAEAKATSKAWRDAQRASAAPRPCGWCGRSFRPLIQTGKPEPRFCGKSCAARYGNSIRPERFGWMAPRLAATPAAPPQACEECGTSFRPKWKGNRYCGKLCSNRANRRKRLKS
jgi:hypothetical protein